MSGNRKGREAAREAAEELRSLGCRVVLAHRDGADWGPDVDAFVRISERRWLPLQVKRREDPRPEAWRRDFVGRGVCVMYRRNRERWTVLLIGPGGFESHNVESFAALVLGGVLA